MFGPLDPRSYNTALRFAPFNQAKRNDSSLRMTQYTPGQRWISEAEPELGLGTVLRVEDGRVGILFSASGDMRQYSVESAPLKRVQFRKGDSLKSCEGEVFTVVEIEESDGLLIYHGEGVELPEAQLSDTISFSKPEERLLYGKVDEPQLFDLRLRALEHQHRARKSEARGFVGGRIDLIPHQLYIAREVTSRQAPRILLSDEVGLGKTIEAALILHRFLVSGRVDRALILVPDSLVHQWFVELYRRFNLWFNIFDEERCVSIEANNPGENPFLDDQLALCSLDFLAADEKRARQAIEAGWDFLIVDEAHHLEWTPEAPSVEYAIVEILARKVEGLLLLTATPEQIGEESHFARLRLLDPNRYHDLGKFAEEAEHHQAVVQIVEKLLSQTALSKADRILFSEVFHFDDADMERRLGAIEKGDSDAREILIGELLDRHGMGRVMFRNTRAAMENFPQREARLTPLARPKDDPDILDRLSVEFAVDAGDQTLTFAPNYETDPRIIWLAALLRDLKDRKVLLICRTREKVAAIDHALRLRITTKSGMFHEDLTLIQRDRNAAWFAEKDGAQILICSEIGSEGRNFQFAQHLVLFDLPLNPELVEQRIGRLDRIGQTADIQIHVPYVAGSSQQVMVRWYHEGLDGFESSLACGNELMKRFGRQAHDLALEYPADPEGSEEELSRLLESTEIARKELNELMEKGRDRLLEMSSFKPASAAEVIARIRQNDADPELEEFMLQMFDHYGVQLEEMASRTYALGAGGLLTDAFPSLPDEGAIATFDRVRALSREDVMFLSWDHPMVTGSMELLLGSEQGNCAFGLWNEEGAKLILGELVFIVECVAPGHLQLDRFLPTTPVRIVVDHRKEDRSDDFPRTLLQDRLSKGSVYRIVDNADFTQNLLPGMLKAGGEFAEARIGGIKAAALSEMELNLRGEIERLRALQRVNDHIREDEIESLDRQLALLREQIFSARLRLDSIRLIWKGPEGSLA
jgi:ATP-dependent helicase HepA